MSRPSGPPTRSPGLWRCLFARSVVVRGLKVAAVIGTLLVAINQGDRIWAGDWPPLWKLLLTFFVPYVVSTYSAAANMAARRGADASAG